VTSAGRGAESSEEPLSTLIEELICRARMRAPDRGAMLGGRGGHWVLRRREWSDVADLLLETLARARRAERYDKGTTALFANPWTVYALRDRGKVGYIGQTWTHPVLRLLRHCTVFRHGREKNAWILGVLRARRFPELHVLSIHHDEVEACAAESAWRAHFANLGAPLTNYQQGTRRQKEKREAANVPGYLPPGTVWATHLPGGRVALSPETRRMVWRGRKGKPYGAGKARRRQNNSAWVPTTLTPVPAEAAKRAVALRRVPMTTKKGTRVVSWFRVAEGLELEGLGTHHPVDIAYAVADLTYRHRRMPPARSDETGGSE
jgi:hypothetical protein